MRRHLSLIGVLLVLVAFHLGPKAEAQIDDGYFYVSPAVMMGMNFDFSGDSGLEFYPSLSAQVTGGIATHDYSLAVGFTMLVGGLLLVTNGVWAIQTTSTLIFRVVWGHWLGQELAGLGNPVLKSVPSGVNCSGLLRLGWELNMTVGSG